MARRKQSDGEALRCSFCHKSANRRIKLISTPSDYPRAYICNECITVCWSILEDDKPGSVGVPYTVLEHPLAAELMNSVAQWIQAESLGRDASEELARLRRTAQQMFSG